MVMLRMKAKSINITNYTYFWNASGYPTNPDYSNPGNVNCGVVNDLLKMGIAAMLNPTIQTIMYNQNTILNTYGYRNFNECELVHNDSDYHYSVFVNEYNRTINESNIDMAYDMLLYKGGSLGSSTNPLNWTFAVPNTGTFYSYVGVTEFIDGNLMFFAIHGARSGIGTVYDLAFGIQQYMIAMWNNGKVALSSAQEDALAEAQPLFANIKNNSNPSWKYDGEHDNPQPLSWCAIVIPPYMGLNALNATNLMDDSNTSLMHYCYHGVNKTKLYPFMSTSKLLTCLLVVDSMVNLTKLHTVREEDIISGSGSVLKPGMMINCRDLMYLALWKSDNDACQMLARIVGNTCREQYYASNFPASS